MLNLYKLEIFMRVAQEKNFTAAAERLYLTQSAISQHIKDLENSLGTPLFKRERRGVSLTPAGETLHEYAQKIVRLAMEAEHAVMNVENLASGQVQIGATPGVSVYLLPGWIQSFRKKYPNLTISLSTDVTGHIAADVLANRLDLGFVEGETEFVDDARLGAMVLEEIALNVVIGQGHDWWGKTHIPLRALKGQPFINRQQKSQTRIWIENLLGAHYIQLNNVAEFDNPESIKHAVASGMGITILPQYAIQQECKLGILQAVSLEDFPLRRTLKLLWDQSKPVNAITKAFLNCMMECYPHLLRAHV